MKKISLAIAFGMLLNLGIFSGAWALSETQKTGISERCDIIKYNLKQVQKQDAKTRIYLGGYYEALATDFITPLNMRLVENNLSNGEFVDNQNNFMTARTTFNNDYVTYQKGLEELVAVDCRTKQEEFYSKLETVRAERSKVRDDVAKLRKLMDEHGKLAKALEEKL